MALMDADFVGVHPLAQGVRLHQTVAARA